MKSSEITIRGNKYQLSINENGKQTLKRYSTKHKMWVKIVFMLDNKEDQKVIDDKIIAMLSEEYLRTHK